MISIIGAGPAGCYLAYLLAKKGKDARIFEEHRKIGKPVQCTGLVTGSVQDIIRLKKEVIVNKINKVRIFSHNGKFTEIMLKDDNIVLDREKFDQYLAEKAESHGARVFLEHRFLDYKKGELIIKDLKNDKIKKIRADCLIGADGPLSRVAKSSGLFGKRRFMTGLQIRVKLKNDNAIEFYPHIGAFAWVVPENKEVARLGVASYNKVKESFDYFLKLKDISKNKIIEKQAGLIPIYSSNIKTQKNNVYLVGDAAAQLKATTGGGIIQGLLAAECLADAILNKKSYESLWKKKIGMDLSLHLQMRKALDKFSNEDYNHLISLFSKNNIKKIIEEYDRDFPSVFLLKLLFNEPKLLLFLKYIF